MNYVSSRREHFVGEVAGVKIYLTSHMGGQPAHVTVVWGTRSAWGYIDGPPAYGQLADNLSKMSKKRRDAVLAFIAMKGFT
jgi:hypothetical protein